MLDLGGSNTKSQRTKGAVGRGVAVAADDGGAGQSEALLGADDVDDALTVVIEAEEGQVEVADVLLEGDALRAGVGIVDEAGDVLEVLSVAGWDVLGVRQSRLSGRTDGNAK